MANNPIKSHDLYDPLGGGRDTLELLQTQLAQIQVAMEKVTKDARALRSSLAIKTSPAQVVAAATEADRIASAKRLLLVKEAAIAQRIHNQTLKQQAVGEQQVAAATSRANVARQREIDYANRAATANKSHSSSLKGLIGSVRNLAYAYFSLGAAAQIFQNILKQTKALDTLTVAFNTTLGSTQATAQAQEYLLDISERFGANLLGASQAYLKFSAASKQAGVSAEETQKIFTSVTKASSILGLGAERTSYVFLALEQIMSKGRLSTEELRRQLGEHLPGAFGIAAEAMGVTTAKLTDMLKKGEIASTDFLPKFAVQLEKAYGIDQVERIDNLAAAQERFNNELTLLVKDFDLSSTFKDFFNTLADGVRFVRENVDAFLALGKAILYVGAAWVAWKIGAAVTGIGSLTKAVQALNLAMKANPIGLIAAAAVILIGVMDTLITKFNGAAEAQDALNSAKRTALSQSNIEVKQINNLVEAYGREQTTNEEKAKIIQRLNDMGVTVIDQNKDKKISVDELKASTDAYVESLRDQFEQESVNNKLRELYAKKEDIQGKDVAKTGTRGGAIGAAFDATFGTVTSESGQQKAIAQVDDAISILEAKSIELYERIQNRVPEGGVVGAILNGETGGDGKKTKDPRLVLLEYLDALNKLKEDGLEKDLEALRISFEKEKILHEGKVEYLLELDKWYAREKDKLISDDSEASRTDLESRAKSITEAFERLRQFRAANLQQGAEEAEKNRKESVDALRTEFEQRRDHEKAIFDLSKHTAEEEADFNLRLKAEELNDEIQLHRIFGKVLNDEELARAIELRDKILAEIGNPNTAQAKEEVDIFSLLGINFDSPEQKEAVIDALDFAKQQLTDFLDFQKEIIDQEIENADRKVRAAEENLNRQIALATAGQANNVAGAQAQLALDKKTQEEALKQRQKFQKTELALNSVLEASHLAVAIARTLKDGGAFAIPLVAVMLGAFAAAKIKAFQLANKKTFRKGGFEEIGGGSHESGRDTNVGGNNYAEKGESVGIFTAKATRKYKPSLKTLVNAANKGTLENILIQDRRAIQGINMINKTDIDTSLMEKRLTRLVSLNEAKTFVDQRGRLVRIDRGRTTIINR